MERKASGKSVTVSIPADTIELAGDLSIPDHPKGIVLFAHGSGSSRSSPRNQFVAQTLQGAGIATLLFDLLTSAEARDRANVFDIPFLAERLRCAQRFAREALDTRELALGYFGASTGAAAALVAAAGDDAVRAIVSRGGRPDLAAAALPLVTAPTLLIVGGDDSGVIELNEAALRMLRCRKKLEIVPGASHLFEEPGTLEEVTRLASTWFTEHLASRPDHPRLERQRLDRRPTR